MSSTLGTWQRCPSCKEWGFSGQHVCLPEWEACDADDMDWTVVRGSTEEGAAEAYCYRRDPFSEYGAVSASRKVLVRPVGRDDRRKAFMVYGEVQPVYNATLQQYAGEE